MPSCQTEYGASGFGRRPFRLLSSLDRWLFVKLLHGFDKSSRLVELQSQSDPVHLKRKKPVAVFCGSGEPCKLCTTLRVLTTFFGIAWHLGLHRDDAFLVARENEFQRPFYLSMGQSCTATRSPTVPTSGRASLSLGGLIAGGFCFEGHSPASIRTAMGWGVPGVGGRRSWNAEASRLFVFQTG